MSASKMIIAGFGGQGVMLIGEIIAYAAMIEGKHVTWLPAYGPEMRGGTANCSIIVSNEEISSPVIASATDLVAFNYPSLVKFEPILASGGRLFINSSLIKEDSTRRDITIYKIAANDIAQSLGSDKITNMVILGTVIATTSIVKKKSIIEVFNKVFIDKKAKYIPLNIQAFEEVERLARN